MIELYQGDCLEVMKTLPDKSIDLVLTDPPYGTTACKWDSVIPLEPMWEELKRITKDNAAKNLNRDFIGIEMDENYFNIAKQRIEST